MKRPPTGPAQCLWTLLSSCENSRNGIDRRSALTLGLAVAALTVTTDSAVAQPYSASQGTEIAPGVWLVELGKRASIIPGYKSVTMRDVVYQPRAKSSNRSMTNDVVCHCIEGELRIKQGAGMEFVAKKGDVWTCTKGSPEDGENVGHGAEVQGKIQRLHHIEAALEELIASCPGRGRIKACSILDTLEARSGGAARAPACCGEPKPRRRRR